MPKGRCPHAVRPIRSWQGVRRSSNLGDRMDNLGGREVSWQLSLGMHLFRQAERETLRVRQSKGKGNLRESGTRASVKSVAARDKRSVARRSRRGAVTSSGESGKTLELRLGLLALPFVHSRYSSYRKRQAGSIRRRPVAVVESPVKARTARGGKSSMEPGEFEFNGVLNGVKNLVPLSNPPDAKLRREWVRGPASRVYSRVTVTQLFDGYPMPVDSFPILADEYISVESEYWDSLYKHWWERRQARQKRTRARGIVRRGSNVKEKRRSWLVQVGRRTLPVELKKGTLAKQYRWLVARTMSDRARAKKRGEDFVAMYVPSIGAVSGGLYSFGRRSIVLPVMADSLASARELAGVG